MTKEPDLAATLGISIQELRDFRTQELDEETHYEPKPFRYTELGVKVTTDWFTKGLQPPELSCPDAGFTNPEAGAPVPFDPPAPTMAVRLSPLRPTGLQEPPEGYVYPVVSRIPPNRNLIVCDVGPHRNVRVGVKSNEVYVPRMTIPLAIPLEGLDPLALLVFTGRQPRRKGCW